MAYFKLHFHVKYSPNPTTNPETKNPDLCVDPVSKIKKPNWKIKLTTPQHNWKQNYTSISSSLHVFTNYQSRIQSFHEFFILSEVVLFVHLMSLFCQTPQLRIRIFKNFQYSWFWNGLFISVSRSKQRTDMIRGS